MKRFIITLISLTMICSTAFAYTSTDVDNAKQNATSYKNRMDIAHIMAESARQLGYPENCATIAAAKKEYNTNYTKYQEAMKLIKWEKQIKEYPTAATIWIRLTEEYKLSDPVAAGIMGNIMVEVGGATLNLNPNAQGNFYYGICQWNKGYKSQIWGKGLNEQIDFLMSTIKYEIDTFGFCYKSGFKYTNFLELKDETKASLVFSKAYERCGSGTYKMRQRCATKALKYFTSK